MQVKVINAIFSSVYLLLKRLQSWQELSAKHSKEECLEVLNNHGKVFSLKDRLSMLTFWSVVISHPSMAI